ncbi:uncharacterized protein LOC143601198 [Bidens hawaiensis]|uniref:uncharacterized protein LOC143601198 n=1 Tax=Bidens hawaiensis TaxID=980011 RepID=UPI004049BC19
MSRNQNADAPTNKSLKTSEDEDSGLRDWSNLTEDLLLRITWKLEPTDFFGFRGTCNPWRSMALSQIKKFMGSRRPMKVSCSNGAFYFEDFEGRKHKIPLPHSTGRVCIGVTCGYMIMAGRDRDFWLVNPFKRHEIYIPACPFHPWVNTNASQFRGVLVFSPFTSQPVFVFSHKFTNKIFYHMSGNQPSWNWLDLNFPILDIHAFKGKIYAVTVTSCLVEVGLPPRPSLEPLEMKNHLTRHLLRSEFVTSGKSLYLLDCCSADGYDGYEIDVEKREYVQIDKTTVENAFFVGDWKSSAAVDADTWVDSQIPDGKGGYLKDTSEKSDIKGRCLIANMWYFPHELNCGYPAATVVY